MKRQLPQDWDLKGLKDAVFNQFNFRLNISADNLDGNDPKKLSQVIHNEAVSLYNQKEASIGADNFRNIERFFMLQTVDNLWKDHLLSMDHLREGIGLRGYAQQDPIMIYKKEAFEMFQDMISRIKEETLQILFRIQIAEPKDVNELSKTREQEMTFSHGSEGIKKKAD